MFDIFIIFLFFIYSWIFKILIFRFIFIVLIYCIKRVLKRVWICRVMHKNLNFCLISSRSGLLDQHSFFFQIILFHFLVLLSSFSFLLGKFPKHLKKFYTINFWKIVWFEFFRRKFRTFYLFFHKNNEYVRLK